MSFQKSNKVSYFPRKLKENLFQYPFFLKGEFTLSYSYRRHSLSWREDVWKGLMHPQSGSKEGQKGIGKNQNSMSFSKKKKHFLHHGSTSKGSTMFQKLHRSFPKKPEDFIPRSQIFNAWDIFFHHKFTFQITLAFSVSLLWLGMFLMAPLPRSHCVLYQETWKNIGRYKYGPLKAKP